MPLRLILLSVIVVLALAIGIFLNAALRRKNVRPLPQRRPRFCILPKYCMELELAGPEEDWADEVNQRITRLGFALADDSDDYLSYQRGSQYDDISADAVRIAIIVRLPIGNPAVLALQYAGKFGVLFDTGNLWKVADSIRTELTSSDQFELNTD